MNVSGIKVQIGERVFTLSPITLGVMRKFKLLDDFKTVSAISGQVPSSDEIEAMLRVVHASASVAEPELTFDQFCEQGLDTIPFIEAVTQIANVLPIVLNVSGFVKKQEDTPPGEALAS